MGVKVVARIQAHPSRAHLHGLLAESLGLPTEIMLHADEPANPWLGYRECLSNLPDCSHLLIIQDDARVSQNFAAALERVASEVPTALFLARLPLRVSTLALRAAKRRECYVETRMRINEFVPVVGILWPVNKAREFLVWTEENPRKLAHQSPRSDDGVLGRWCAITHQTVRFTIPSLVQHPDEVPSLIGKQASWGKDKGRTALLFAEDALQYDW